MIRIQGRLRAGASASGVAFALTTLVAGMPAHADVTSDTSGTAEAQDTESRDDIIVTGTHIARPELESAITVRPNEQYSVTLGVKNISNNGVFAAIQDTAISPHAAGNGRSIGPAYYDAIGRYFFAKVDMNF